MTQEHVPGSSWVMAASFVLGRIAARLSGLRNDVQVHVQSRVEQSFWCNRHLPCCAMCAVLTMCAPQLVALVQRCRCEQRHEAVRSLAEMILTRWRWQLAGHMQVGSRSPVDSVGSSIASLVTRLSVLRAGPLACHLCIQPDLSAKGPVTREDSRVLNEWARNTAFRLCPAGKKNICRCPDCSEPRLFGASSTSRNRDTDTWSECSRVSANVGDCAGAT